MPLFRISRKASFWVPAFPAVLLRNAGQHGRPEKAELRKQANRQKKAGGVIESGHAACFSLTGKNLTTAVGARKDRMRPVEHKRR